MVSLDPISISNLLQVFMWHSTAIPVTVVFTFFTCHLIALSSIVIRNIKTNMPVLLSLYSILQAFSRTPPVTSFTLSHLKFDVLPHN